MGETKHPRHKKYKRQALLTWKRNKDRALLKLITDVINTSFGRTEEKEWLVGSICQLMDAEASTLLLTEEDYVELVTKKVGVERPIWTCKVGPERENDLIEKSIQSHTPLLINDVSNDTKLETLNAIPDVEAVSILCVPLVFNDTAMGALVVFNKRLGSFNSQDQELLAIVATSTANAIYNSRVIQQLKVANAELEVSHWQLLHSRNTLRALFDSIPTSIYIIDRKYNLAAVNMHRSHRTNDSPNVLVGRRCYESLYQRDDVCPGCRVIETLFGGESTTRTKRQWETDDEPKEWEISTYPIYDDAKSVTQAILLEQDVTEKRRLEATLAQSEKLAAVGQLAAGLAHEINNPLTAIIANAQLLQRELPPDDDNLELVDLIARAGDRAKQVVRSLLDLARKEQYNFVPTDLNESISKSLVLLHHEFVSKSINLIYEPADNLPRIMASQDHLQGVWVNLLSNAIDAMENGPCEIRVNTRQQGNEIRVVVSDTGKGITPQRLSRVFEPFYTTKAPGRGTGLGLSVCHRVVKEHGGRILVDSQVGVGTEFTVLLPIS